MTKTSNKKVNFVPNYPAPVAIDCSLVSLSNNKQNFLIFLFFLWKT